MRLFAILLFLFFAFSISLAQEEDALETDLVVLQNRVSITGKIESVNRLYVIISRNQEKIRLEKGSVDHIFYAGDIVSFVGNYEKTPNGETSELEQLKLDTIFTNDENEYYLSPIFNFEKYGLYNISSSGIIVPIDDGEVGFGLEHTIGYQFSQFTGIGLGVGLYFSGKPRYGPILPIYLDYRGYFHKERISAYYNLAFGLAKALQDKGTGFVSSKPGSYFYPSFGLKFTTSEVSFMIDLGLRFTNIQYTMEGSFQSFEQNQTRRLAIMRLGLMF